MNVKNFKTFTLNEKEKENFKKTKLKKKRYLYYKPKKDVENSDTNFLYYILLDDINKEKNVFSKFDMEDCDFPKEEVNVFSFYNKDYLLYKCTFLESEKKYYETKYVKEKGNNNYEIKKRYIKGYLCLINDKNEEFLVPIVSKKIFPIIFLSLFYYFPVQAISVLAAASVLGTIIGKSIIENKSNQKSNIIFAEDSTEYDDTPIETNNIDNESEAINETDGEIKLNLIIDQTVNESSEIPFSNYSTNIDNLRYLVTLTDSEDIIYDTGILKPGTEVSWKVSDYLEKGEYVFDVYLIPYTSDGEEGFCTRVQTNVNINIQ